MTDKKLVKMLHCQKGLCFFAIIPIFGKVILGLPRFELSAGFGVAGSLTICLPNFSPSRMIETTN
jgi:hypothetical protein